MLPPLFCHISGRTRHRQLRHLVSGSSSPVSACLQHSPASAGLGALNRCSIATSFHPFCSQPQSQAPVTPPITRFDTCHPVVVKVVSCLMQSPEINEIISSTRQEYASLLSTQRASDPAGLDARCQSQAGVPLGLSVPITGPLLPKRDSRHGCSANTLYGNKHSEQDHSTRL